MPFADNKGIGIHYHVEGDGTPLVLQHGLTSDIERWYMHGYVNELSDDYKLLIVDARGHGKSDKLHSSDKYDGELMASDVISVLDQEGINKAHYIGYSMGGSIGFFLAKSFANRFYSLIIGGMHPYPLGGKLFDEMELILRDGMETYAETYDPPLTGKRLKNMLANDNLALIAAGLGLKERPDLSTVLPDIDIPCMLYVGDQDSLHEGAEQCATQIEGCSWVSLPGFDHSDAMERGDVIMPHVRAFLSELA